MLVKQKEKMKNVQVSRVVSFAVSADNGIRIRSGEEGAEAQDEKYVRSFLYNKEGYSSNLRVSARSQTLTSVQTTLNQQRQEKFRSNTQCAV